MQQEKDYLEEQVSHHETEEHEDHSAHVSDYSTMDRSEIYGKMQELATSDDASRVKAEFERAYHAYQDLVREEFEKGREAYIADGGVAEDYSGVRNELDQKAADLDKQFHRRISEKRREREQELKHNLQVRQELIDELRSLTETEGDITVNFERWHQIQQRWREAGSVPPAHREEIYNNYRHFNNLFFAHVQVSRELRELDLKKNAELKEALCVEAEALKEETEAGKALRQYRVLQQRWRETGPVPKEVKDTLWDRFQKAGEAVLQRRDEALVEMEKQKEANLILKKDLLARMEKLAESTPRSQKDVKKISEASELLFADWKKIGYVPDSDDGQTWKAFRAARNKIFKLKDTYFAQRREEFSSNLKEKIRLCEAAEALQNSTDWQNTARKFKQLQDDWKKTGPVSRKYADKIWSRFRKSCDAFFKAREEEKKTYVESLEANGKAREQFIVELEALDLPEDPGAAMEILNEKRASWNQLGLAPREQRGKLDQAFSQVLNKKLAVLKEATKGNPEIYYKLHYQQIQADPEGEQKLFRERKQLQDRIKKLEHENIQLENNLGFFGRSSAKNPIVKEYESKLEKGKQEIADLKKQLARIPRT